MNGTVAPPSSNSTVAATCVARTFSSLASKATIRAGSTACLKEAVSARTGVSVIGPIMYREFKRRILPQRLFHRKNTRVSSRLGSPESAYFTLFAANDLPALLLIDLLMLLQELSDIFSPDGPIAKAVPDRSEEHTSELQSLMRIPYAVYCLKKINKKTTIETT